MCWDHPRILILCNWILFGLLNGYCLTILVVLLWMLMMLVLLWMCWDNPHIIMYNVLCIMCVCRNVCIYEPSTGVLGPSPHHMLCMNCSYLLLPYVSNVPYYCHTKHQLHIINVNTYNTQYT